MKNSIRLRLTRSFLWIILLALTISGILGFFTARHEIDELFDAQLVEEARVLAGVLSMPAQDIDWRVLQQALAHLEQAPAGSGYDATYDKKVAVQIWSSRGDLLFRSRSAPQHALAPLRAGFHVQRSEHHVWHVHTVFIQDNHYWLLVAERSDVRQELSASLAASLLIGFLASLGLAVVMLRKRLRRDLAPLAELRQAISERELDHLHRIQLQDEPEEIRPVTEAINHLFGRVSQGVERERAFIADAAHELRTPLSIIRLHAQNALQHQDIDSKNRSLAKVIQGVDRNTRVVQQLLMMARLDAPEVEQGFRPTDPASVAAAVLQEMRPVFDTASIRLERDFNSGAATLSGSPELLGAMMRNLLENAANHTPAGGVVRMTIRKDPGEVRIRVEDSGPGVPEDRLDHIVRRHVSDGPRDTRGTGLGLEIVARIVRLHRGSLRFSRGTEGGLRVEAVFPVD